MKLTFLFLIPFLSFSQIKIPDVGDGWKKDVDSAITIIKKYDIEKYNLLLETCERIEYWNGDFSTTDGKNTISISTKDLKKKNIHNISAILVHESLHLYISKMNFKIDENMEEIIAYNYELELLTKIPEIEKWLIENAKSKIIFYSK